MLSAEYELTVADPPNSPQVQDLQHEQLVDQPERFASLLAMSLCLG
jgi:hypothetical protein